MEENLCFIHFSYHSNLTLSCLNKPLKSSISYLIFLMSQETLYGPPPLSHSSSIIWMSASCRVLDCSFHHIFCPVGTLQEANLIIHRLFGNVIFHFLDESFLFFPLDLFLLCFILIIFAMLFSSFEKNEFDPLVEQPYHRTLIWTCK